MKQEILQSLKRIVIDMDLDNAEKVVREALENGIDPMDCSKVLTEGINEIGEKFGKGELFLPELIAAADVMKIALPPINKAIKESGQETHSIGKVVVGTVSGDIHSIGKDMVSTLLFASGFKVYDLGVDVGSDEFLNTLKEKNADILAMSALLTTTITSIKETINRLSQEGLRNKVKIIIGGAPTSQEFADSIGADGYGATASEGVVVAKRLMGIEY